MGVGVAPRPGRFTPWKDQVFIVQEAGWVPGPVWTGAENLSPTQGFDPRTVKPVASRYTDWAIAAWEEVISLDYIRLVFCSWISNVSEQPAFLIFAVERSIY